jgi:hypothetical protein
MSRLSGTLRWLRGYGHRIPALGREAARALRSGGVGGLSSWWRGKRAVFERWQDVADVQLGYGEWQRERALRRARLERVAEPGLFSIVTSAYDTHPSLLEEAARSVREQSFQDLEWVLVDNGSTKDETRRALESIAARDRRVALWREAKNEGPLAGIRRGLERARGTYVVPFDSDDMLEKDALAVLAHEIVNQGRPSFLYSDEEVLVLEERVPFLRTGWDPVQVVSNSYIFHLCAIDRARALELGVCSDPGASWCHDWDTALRVLRAGLTARHVPEVLYTWRAHPGSATNRERAAPDRTNSLASQKHVLEAHLSARGLGARFAVETSPIDRGAPEYWLRRLPLEPAPLVLARLGGGGEGTKAEAAGEYPWLEVAWARTPGDLRALSSRAREKKAWIALLGEGVSVEAKDWAWQALGLRELFPDAAVIGGRILGAQGRVLLGAGHWGFGGLAGSPETGRDRRDPGYCSMLLKQHSSSTVPSGLCAFDPLLLDSVPEDASLGLLDAWLGAAAERAGRRVVYSPFMVAQGPAPPPASPEEAARFVKKNRDLIPDERFYGRHFRLDQEGAFSLARPGQRARQVESLLASLEGSA